MDKAECLAKKYLDGLDQGLVVYEPDGNIPPDFSLGGKIGVEVRRLDQNYERSDGMSESLEQVAVPLWRWLKKLLPTLGPSAGGESWFVAADFRRPIGSWRSLEARIRQELAVFMNNPNRQQGTIHITENFSLYLLPSSTDHGSFFLLGGAGDDDEGGWILAEIERNLRLCIAEKERKIAPYRNRYAEWWLVLPDHIDFSMEHREREQFRATVAPTLQHSFNKIVLLDPLGHRLAFEI